LAGIHHFLQLGTSENTRRRPRAIYSHNEVGSLAEYTVYETLPLI